MNAAMLRNLTDEEFVRLTGYPERFDDKDYIRELERRFCLLLSDYAALEVRLDNTYGEDV